jgi:hypothetical protein
MRRGCGRREVSAWVNGQGLKLESVRMESRDVSANWLKARRAIRKGITLYVPSLSDGPDRPHIAYIFLNLIATSLLSSPLAAKIIERCSIHAEVVSILNFDFF